MSSVRTWVSDAVLLALTLLLSLFVIAGIFLDLPTSVSLTASAGLVFVSVGLAASRLATRPDHLKALQSHRILEVADRSLVYLRRGLDPETAQAVCHLALMESEAAAVAITDRETVLGFAGIGEDHHEVGGPIITRATREAIEQNEHRVLSSKEEIGCPRKECPLRAAIVVPLVMRGEAVGTLKFYYTTPQLLNETQVTMAEGLARLLSTQLETSELERQTELACRMELKALQAQINPHFLFNTINTIAMYIRTDPAKARDLLREFAAFYRRMLEENEGLIALQQEVEFAIKYLGFEQARFGDRIEVERDLDPEILDTPVPAFILQPLVENSVQHGVRPDGTLKITLTGRREGRAVKVRVIDDGVGISAEDLPRVMEPGFGKGLGIALKNVDDRLKGFFGVGSGLAIESTPGRGTTVTMTIVPLQAEADE